MSTSLIDRRITGVLLSMLIAIGVAAAPAQLATSGEAAQTHALQTHA